MQIKWKKGDYKRLKKAMKGANKRNIEQQLATALNKANSKLYSATSKPQGVSQMVRAKLNIKAGDLKKNLDKWPRASAKNLVTATSVEKTSRLNLKYFGARQTARGVTYKIEKKGKRGLVPSAFGPKPKEIQKLGGLVWVREGKKRTPIRKVHGISVWGFIMKNGLEPVFWRTARIRLREEIRERARFITQRWGKK